MSMNVTNFKKIYNLYAFVFFRQPASPNDRQFNKTVFQTEIDGKDALKKTLSNPLAQGLKHQIFSHLNFELKL